MKTKKTVLRLIAIMSMVVMMFGSSLSVFAATPSLEEVEYDGAGKVEVEFYGKVNWKAPKVTVKDTQGRTYTATIIKKDNDDISFRVKNYRAGTRYNFTISGVKTKGTSGFGTVKGTFSIPAAKKVVKPQAITANKAKTAAINSAVTTYKVNKKTIRDFDIEKDTYRGKKVWEVSFEAKRTGKTGWFEVEYKIDAATGKVLYKQIERD